MSEVVEFDLQFPTPQRPPSRELTFDVDQCIGAYWEPISQQEFGKIEIYHPQPVGNIGTYPEFVDDADRITRFEQYALDSSIPLINTTLGIVTARQGHLGESQLIETTVPHPEYFSRRAAALGAAARVATIRFTPYDGGIFPIDAFAQELIHNDAILIAAKPGSEEIAHDPLTHGSTWIYAPASFVDRAQHDAHQALKGGQQMLNSFMAGMDGIMSTVGVGRKIAQAAAQEASVVSECAIETAWHSAGETLSYALGTASTDADVRKFAHDLREQYNRLSTGAAATLKK